MRLAFLQLAGAMALVGANIPVAKAAVVFIPVFIFSMIRYAVSVAILLPFLKHEPGGRFADLTRPQWGLLVLQAISGGLFYMVCMLYGLKFTSAMTAGIITSTVPLMVALLAVLLLGEKLGARTVLALGLAVLGILAVNTASPRPEIASWPLLGNLLVGCAVIAESLFVIFARRMAGDLSPFRMAFIINAMGLILAAPFAAAEMISFSFRDLPLQVWLLPVFYALTSSVMALVLWYRGLAVVPASKAAIFTSTFPISAVAVSVAFLGEEPQLAHFAGLGCVVFAIAIGARAR